MSKGAKIAIALGLGLLAALFGMLYISGKEAALLGGSEIVKVYTAAIDIKPNVALEPDMLTTREIPKTFLQPGSIPVTEVPDKAKLTGVTLVPIKAGEQIVRSKLYEGAPPPLSAELRIRPGMVGVAIEMAGLPTSLHGLVKAGDRVDVLASFQFDKGNDDTFTEVRPLFMNVEVMAINDKTAGNQRISRPEPEKTAGQSEAQIAKTVTLAMPPAAAQQIVLAQQLGNIWLLLRGKGDNSPHQYEIWNNERLLQSPYRLWKAADSRAELMKQLAQRSAR